MIGAIAPYEDQLLFFVMKGIQMDVLFADHSHLDGIMEIEAETFGALGEEATASRALMADRIDRCNINGAGWFLVAVHEGVVSGYMILQPTRLTEEECVSWDVSTDHGTFRGTYDESGATIFVASLGARRSAPPGAVSLLIHRGLVLMIARNKKPAIFCSRMPSLSHALLEKGVDPEQYCFQTDESGKPVDWLIREFTEFLGVLPKRFLPNGYPPDTDSLGHGAQFVLEDLFAALELTVQRVYQSGVAYGKSLRKRRV